MFQFQNGVTMYGTKKHMECLGLRQSQVNFSRNEKGPS